MKKLKNLFYIFLSFIFTLLFLNLIFISFKGTIVNQKYLSKQLLNVIPVDYRYLYADTKKDYNEYIAILGDSYAFGSGDSYLNDDYDYSIGHHLYKFTNKKYNFVSFGFDGGGTESVEYNFLSKINSFLFDLPKPKKIIYIFYEGNDLENNINYRKLVDKGRNLISFEKKIRKYLPILDISKRLIYKLRLEFKKPVNINNSEVNSYKVRQNLYRTSLKFQAPPVELSEYEINYSLEILFHSLRKLKKEYNNIYFIYMPSPATVLNLNDPIHFQKYFPESKIKIATKEKIFSLNNSLVDKINDFSKTHKIKFLDLTAELNNIAKNNLIFGPVDFKHLNKAGYTKVAELIYKFIIK